METLIKICTRLNKSILLKSAVNIRIAGKGIIGMDLAGIATNPTGWTMWKRVFVYETMTCVIPTTKSEVSFLSSFAI